MAAERLLQTGNLGSQPDAGILIRRRQTPLAVLSGPDNKLRVKEILILGHGSLRITGIDY